MDKIEVLSKHIAELVKLRESINIALEEPFNVELSKDLENLGTYQHYDARSISTEFVRRKNDDRLFPSNFEDALRYTKKIAFESYREYIENHILAPMESKIASLKKEMLDFM